MKQKGARYVSNDSLEHFLRASFTIFTALSACPLDAG